MKKIFSLLLVAALLVSAVPTALATNDYTAGTKVEYVATGSESYTITVPALLTPEGSGNVVAQGTWACDRKLVVTADTQVELTNSINAADTKTLDVSFDGISKLGDNTAIVTATEEVSVGAIENALFGTWSGTFYYNAAIIDATFVGWNYNGRIFKEKIPEVEGCENTILYVLPAEFLDVMFEEQGYPELVGRTGMVAQAAVTREPGDAIYRPEWDDVGGMSVPEKHIYLGYYLECADDLTPEEMELIAALLEADLSDERMFNGWCIRDGGYGVGYGMPSEFVVWCNYDIINEEDGSVFITAYPEPFKVYE